MSELREAPSTDHDLLVRIWTILEGTNGSGLITRFACIEEDMAKIKMTIPMLWTKAQHDESIEKHGERRKLSVRSWIAIGVAIIGPTIAIILSHFIK